MAGSKHCTFSGSPNKAIFTLPHAHAYYVFLIGRWNVRLRMEDADKSNIKLFISKIVLIYVFIKTGNHHAGMYDLISALWRFCILLALL